MSRMRENRTSGSMGGARNPVLMDASPPALAPPAYPTMLNPRSDAFIGGLLEADENPNLGITLKFPVHEDGDYSIEPGAAEVARRTLAEREER